MKQCIVIFVLLVFVVNTVTAQSKEEKKAMKKEQEAQAYEDLQDFLNKGVYEFEADWASTQRGKRISLMSNPNFLKVDSQKVDAFFPFFGVAHSASYGGNGGIEFKGDAKNLKLAFDDKKQHAEISFKSENNMETFDVTLTVFSNWNATLTVLSNKRDMMRYSGIVSPRKEKDN